MKENPLPAFGNLESTDQLECKFSPKLRLTAGSGFEVDYAPCRPSCKCWVLQYKNHRSREKSWTQPYLFSQPLLSGWNPSSLVTLRTFCLRFGWVAGEAVSLLQFVPFLPFRSFLLTCVCLSLLKIASQAVLGLSLICQCVSSFLSDERSIHLSLQNGTQATPHSHPQTPRDWHPLFLLSVLPEISQLTLRSASWEAELLF
jgi:hypothetical protein